MLKPLPVLSASTLAPIVHSHPTLSQHHAVTYLSAEQLVKTSDMVNVSLSSGPQITMAKPAVSTHDSCSSELYKDDSSTLSESEPSPSKQDDNDQHGYDSDDEDERALCIDENFVSNDESEPPASPPPPKIHQPISLLANIKQLHSPSQVDHSNPLNPLLVLMKAI